MVLGTSALGGISIISRRGGIQTHILNGGTVTWNELKIRKTQKKRKTTIWR